LGPNFPKGKLPDLKDIWCIHDFEYAARNFLNATAYTWLRTGVGGEYSYRNNLEVYPKVGFKPRMLTGEPHVNTTLTTTILGYNFSAPIFISPAAAPGAIGGYVPEKRELGLLKGAYTRDILYIPAMYAEMSPLEMARAKSGADQVLFQQFYAENNRTFNQEFLKGIEQAGPKAIVWTIDSPADGPRIRNERYTLPATTATKAFSWETYNELKTMTTLPIVPKGILTVEDAKKAVELGAPAIILSNHGARHLDSAPSPLQVALAIREEAPEIFSRTDVLADCGVRYGSDALKLLALGVKAVGMGRPFMYANIYGQAGVERAIDLLRTEIILDGINLGLTDMKQLNASWVSAVRKRHLMS
jgi:isopentenyl diphosphate isomerase/L-lactate dehydrogenase-like FMN-dependent dehydrogenase